ncbi:hypothetical protein BGW80DRAFT_784054 [Lactifluus volemus]|nr:hypothetical protein BGW80DRAFT_784054 [Lactifluus volemus]
MSFVNNLTLSRPQSEEQAVQHEHRGPRVHFQDGSRLEIQPHVPSTPQNDHATLPSVTQPQPVARSSNERPSPQRFTNPFGSSEWELDNPVSNPALDGVRIYHTRLPVHSSSTLDTHRDSLEPSPDNSQTSLAEMRPPARDRYLWSSYQHPYDLEPPSTAYNNNAAAFGPRRLTVQSVRSQRDDVSEGSGSTRLLPPRYSMQDLDVPLDPLLPRRFRDVTVLA